MIASNNNSLPNKSYTREILIVSFVSVLVIILSISLFWYSNTSKIKRQLEDIRDRFEIAKLIHTMSDSTRMRVISAHRMALMDDVFDRFEEQDNFYHQADIFLVNRNKLLSHPAFNELDKASWNKVKKIVSQGGNLHTRIVNTFMDQNDKDAIALLKDGSKPTQDEFVNEFNKILSEKNREVDSIVKQAEQTNDEYLALMIFIGSCAFVYLAIAFMYAYRYISKSEDNLKRTRDLEKSENKYKTEFLSRASHELRTPLNAILGFVQVINMDEDTKLPEEYAIYFKHIERSGWQLLTLVDDIMDITRVCEGNISLNIETISLRETIATCFDTLSDIAKEHNVECRYLCEENIIGKIESDRTRINQILHNLISNAIKYNISSGTVTVIIKEPNDDMVRIEIHNTGKGLTETNIEKLFKPFSSAGGANENDGRGIGLVLTKNLIECLHGHIGVESVPGISTLFWVELPKIYTEKLADTENTYLENYG